MSDLEMWSGLVAFFLPLVIALAQQPRFAGVVRVLIMLAFCVVASVVTTALQGELHWERWFHSLLIMTVATVAFYRNVWKAAQVAQPLEKASTPPKHRRTHPSRMT